MPIKLLPEVILPTPFGKINIPVLDIPDLRKPDMDSRRRAALIQSLGSDFAKIIGVIPVVGDIASDALQDIHSAEVHDLLTPTEEALFRKYDKIYPLDTLGLLRAFMES